MLTGEQVVAILTVLKELRTDPAATPNVTEFDANNSVPLYLIKRLWVKPDQDGDDEDLIIYADGLYVWSGGSLVPYEEGKHGGEYWYENINGNWAVHVPGDDGFVATEQLPGPPSSSPFG